jgi:uncharacterized protein (TIGR02001 family)
MKRLVFLSMVLAALVCSGIASAEEGTGDWTTYFSATLTFTSDYVFRGVSNSDEDMAVQGSFDWAHPSGFYLGVWGSNSDFGADSPVEVDWYGGYANALGPINYDIAALYYTFPGNNADPDIEYFEAHLGLSYSFPIEPVTPTIGVGYNFSPDFYGEDGTAHYVNATLDVALPKGFGVGAEIGYQDVEGDKSTGDGLGMNGNDGFDYTHYKVNGYWSVIGFTFDVAYHATDSDAEDFFGDIADSRVVFSVSRSL